MNMRISIANIFTHLFLLLALLATASCSDWTDQKTVDIDPQHAKEQNPELWARYMETLRTYRQSKHFVTYGSFDNSAEKSKNEGDYLRSLPDSLDIVTPTHPESLTVGANREISPCTKQSAKKCMCPKSSSSLQRRHILPPVLCRNGTN